MPYDVILQEPGDLGSDVVLVVGQSNAGEFGVGKDATFLDTPDPRIRQWAVSGTYVGQSVQAVDSQMQSRIPTGDTTRIGFAMTFCRHWVRQVPPNRHVMIVPAWQGGTGFTSTSVSPAPTGYYLGTDGTGSGTWDPVNGDGGYSLYEAAIARCNAALAANSANRLVAILWLQGEGDMGQLNQTQYAAKLDALIAGFRSRITGAGTVPFIVGQTVPDWASINQQINQALIDTPRRNVNTAFAYGPLNSAGTGADTVHYTAAGQRIMGRSLFDRVPYARANVTGTLPVAPGTVTITQDSSTQTTINVTWVRPLSRVTDYVVQYTTNGGTSWTTLTRTQSIDYTATITGIPVGTTIQARVAAVNETGTGPTTASVALTTVYKYETVNTAPAITGTAAVGQVLTVSNGTWTPTPDSYTYQWRSNGIAITGATASTYTVVSGDTGNTITCTVTAIKGTISGSATTAGVVIGGASLPTGYKYRWKVGDLSALADGAAVTTWASDSGSATSSTLTQSTAAKKPIVTTDAGKRVVRFDGTDDELAFAPPAATAQPVTVIIRGKFRAAPNDPVGLMWANGSGFSLTSTYNGGLRMYAGSAQIQAPTGQITVGTTFTAAAVANGASSAVRVGNNTKVTGNPGTLGISASGARIGYAYGSSDYWTQLDLYEIVIYDRVLTDAEIDQAHTFLNATY